MVTRRDAPRTDRIVDRGVSAVLSIDLDYDVNQQLYD